MEFIDCKLNMHDLCELLNILSIPYSIIEINNNLVHLKIWRNGNTFIMRFERDYGDYKFAGFRGV